MLVAAFSLAIMMAGIRHVSGEMHPFVIVFFRFQFSFLILFPAIAYQRLAPLRTHRFPLHALRSALCALSILMIFTGLTVTPLAKATALQFSAPLFATVLALVFLREAVRARRIAALVVGYLGTLVILRPGFGALDPGSLLILTGSVSWGLGMILTKPLARTETSLTITGFMTLLGTPLVLLAALPVWVTPSWGQLAWLLGISGFGTVGDLCIAQAFKEADATAVIPIDFTKLVWAALIGYLAFSEVPDPGTWIGGIMILGAVTYIAYRERVVESRQ